MFQNGRSKAPKRYRQPLEKLTMNKDFSESMSTLSDKQLVDILTTKRSEYQQEAIVAAENEVGKRKINIGDFEHSNVINTIELVNKDVKLEWYYKVSTLIVPALLTRLIVFIVKSNPELYLLHLLTIPICIIGQVYIFRKLKAEGFERKSSEFKKWTIGAYIFYIALFVLLIILTFMVNARR